MAFLSVTAINRAMRSLANEFPDICERITLAERSRENRRIRALRIRVGKSEKPCGILFTGGVHARELVNPDGLISWAFDLCESVTNDTDLVYGGATFSAEIIRSILESVEIFIIPLVNPDGRAFVFEYDAMWRKNRVNFFESGCLGVDLNRNCEFLFESVIGASTDPCSDAYQGLSAFGEPETQNVKALIDDNPGICYFMDVHSYMELVLFPWGDDELQTADPEMNFRNPDFDDLRGVAGDSDYKEFMPQDDLDTYQSIATSIKDRVLAVRGHEYTVGPSFTTLYPTSGTIKDFCYSRHFVDPSLSKIRAFLIETGREFQPDEDETNQIILEIGAAATQLCFACFCLAEAANSRFDLKLRLDPLRKFRSDIMHKTPVGRHLVTLFQRHGPELFARAAKDAEFRDAITLLLRRASELAQGDLVNARVDRENLSLAQRALELALKGASKEFAEATKTVQELLKLLATQTIGEVLGKHTA
jgi:carboxypeptidase T